MERLNSLMDNTRILFSDSEKIYQKIFIFMLIILKNLTES